MLQRDLGAHVTRSVASGAPRNGDVRQCNTVRAA